MLFVYTNVEQNLHKLFKKAAYKPEGRLSGDVWGLIESRNNQITKWKIFGYLGLSILSLSGSVLSIKSLIEQATHLGFFDYLSLAFSDSGAIATYWKEYTLSLADSLPVASFALSFFLLFILFVSIRNTSHQIKNKLLIV